MTTVYLNASQNFLKTSFFRKHFVGASIGL